MAAYFTLQLDTTPPAVTVGDFSWHRETGTLEVEVFVSDPEATVLVSFRDESGTTTQLARNGNIWWHTFGPDYLWAVGDVSVIAVDPVWNSRSVVHRIEKERLPTSQTYRTLERYPTNLIEYLRYEMGLTEVEVVRAVSDIKARGQMGLRSQTAVDLDVEETAATDVTVDEHERVRIDVDADDEGTI